MSSDRPFAAIDHIGFVVSDLQQALTFFTDVLGFSRVEWRTGTLVDAEGDRMARLFGVDRDASAEFAFVELDGRAIEFLEWQAPRRDRTSPRNSDAGGRHLAIQVSDMEAALDRLRAVPGVQVREPNDRGYVYVATPFGLEIQLLPPA